METDRKRKLHIAVTAAVMVFIFVQSALPGDLSGAESNIIVQLLHSLTGMETETLSLFVRKAAHFTEYLILGVCLALNVRDHMMAHMEDCAEGRSFERKTDSMTGDAQWKYWLTAWFIGTAYAVTDEIHQMFVPDRACAFFDVCIDSAGVAVGLAVAIIILKHRRSY